MQTSLEIARSHAATGERVLSQLERIVNGYDSATAQDLLGSTRALLIEMREEVTRREGAGTQP